MEELSATGLRSQASPRDAARLLAASTPESALLYTGLPSSRECTRLSDAALTCAVGLRLGAEVAAPGRCVCGGELDARGDHALTCNRGAARGARHSEVNIRIRCALASAGVAATLEPVGLDLSDGKRPDGATVLPYSRGREMAWDATIRHTCAPSYIPAASSAARAVAEEAETQKLRKYESLSDRVDFRAVGLETLGSFGAGARALLDDIAARIDARGSAINSRFRLYRRIAAAVQIGNAACVLEAHSRGLKAVS